MKNSWTCGTNAWHGTWLGVFLVIVLVLPVQIVSSEEPGAAKAPLEITSKSMIAENKKNIITFEGSVIAKREDVTLSSERMVVQYDDDRKIQKIFAYEKVTLFQGDKEIQADNATYFASDETVVFTGNPVFKQGDNTVTGTKIVYFIAEERSMVENSKVLLRE